MSFNQFGCERINIESVRRYSQRNMNISEYCAENFGFMNLVDMYYRSVGENAIVIFMFICILFPILFMLIAAVADKYLANGMKDLSDRFKLSPTVAAMTLLAFANGAPDILGALGSAGKPGGALIGVGSLSGAFLFSTTLVASNVIVNTPGNLVHLPKTAIIKELVFYLIAVGVIVAFGFIKVAGYPFVVAYFTAYGLYVGTTVVLEKKAKQAEAEEGDTNLEALENETRDEEEGGIEQNANPEEKNQAQLQKDVDNFDLIAEEIEEENISEKGLMGQICDEMFEDENSQIENLVLAPLMLAAMITNCYLDNPLMKTPLKHPIIANSIIFMIVFLELAEIDLAVLFLGAYGIAAIFMVMDYIKISKFVMDIIYEFISVLAAIGWISIFAGLVIDCIAFLAFYFSINQVVLVSLLLSAGNTVGDFFGIGALARAGEPVMAMMGVYSGQVFNNFVGFGAVMLAATSAGVTDFDIFALNYSDTLPTGESVPPPIGSYYLMMILLFVVVNVIISLVVHSANNFVAKQSFINIMVPFYLTFFGVSLVFAIMTRGN